MVRVGETLAGRYELVEVIGQGGMGVVYRGRDRTLDRTVAVKVLPALYADNPTLVERFEREARAPARLSHPNIVSVFDSGQAGTVRYIVMECVPGVSLALLLHERGPLDVSEAVEIAGQIASALGAAHAGGIVHRDVKPANVMVLPSGAIKVLDFGIARAAADAALTRTTMVLGSAPYLAPEVALGGSADERSDIYSLGCVLYEMLTGRPPFLAEVPAAVMNQHVTAAPRPPSELQSGIPIALDALVMRMLAKPPDERPQRAADLVSALHASLTEPAPAAPAAVTAGAATADAVDQAPRGRPIEARSSYPPDLAAPPQRSSRRAWLVVATLILALAAGVALAVISSSSSGPKQSTSGRQSLTAPGTASTRGSGQTTSTSRTATSKTQSTRTSGTTSATTSTPRTSLTQPSTTAPSGSSTAGAPGRAHP
jgi:serine/threonine-protein kinase